MAQLCTRHFFQVARPRAENEWILLVTATSKRVCRAPPFATRASGKEQENVSPSGFLAASGCRPTANGERAREAFPEFNDSSPNLRAPLQESNRRVLNFFFIHSDNYVRLSQSTMGHIHAHEKIIAVNLSCLFGCQVAMLRLETLLSSCQSAAVCSVGTGRVRNTE